MTTEDERTVDEILSNQWYEKAPGMSRAWDDWQATPEGKLDVRALFDRMGDESPTTYAARKEAEVERLREALDVIHEEAFQAEHYGRPVDTGWLMEVAARKGRGAHNG